MSVKTKRAASRKSGSPPPFADGNLRRENFNLNVEAEEYDVAVLYHIVLALGADFALFARAHKAAALQKGLPIYNLCAYKSALKVAVYLSCRLGGFSAASNGGIRLQ